MDKLQKLIDLAAKSTRFGQLDMQLGVHDGQIKYMVGSEHASKNFSTSGMQDAVNYALQGIARERNALTTGALTVTFEFIKGNVKKVHVHRNFRHDLTDIKK